MRRRSSARSRTRSTTCCRRGVGADARLHFVDNVDPETLGALLEWVDLRKALVHVVSKSGGTVETAAGFQIVREALERRVGGRWAQHCVATTGTGALRRFAQREGIPILPFPADVGGRFSGLTPSGLFSPAVAGVDVAGLLAEDAASRSAWLEPRPTRPGAPRRRRRLPDDRSEGQPIHVLMPYGDALEPTSRWYVQLAGESLGKRRGRGAKARGVGPTPLPARGTTDQHSQVQLFVEGPADKLVVFVATDRDRRSPDHPGRGPGRRPRRPRTGWPDAGPSSRGTAVALARAGRPSLCWHLPEVSPDALGQLFVALEVQTAAQAALHGINAYDQPGVEAGKIAAFALLGRDGYEDERVAIEADAPPSWRV